MLPIRPEGAPFWAKEGELHALPKAVLAKAYQGLGLLRATGFLDRSDRFARTRALDILSEA
jgi:hypothetical protein